jgi:chromosome segregation ATPase
MATLHSYEDYDPEKSISLLTHLARASKRIFEKDMARKHVEAHIAQLKKVSTKGIKQELEILEQKIADALAKESKIKSRQEQETVSQQNFREKLAAIEKKLEIYAEQSEARAQRIRELEEQVQEKHMTRAEKAEIVGQRISQLEKVYNQLKSQKEKVSKTKLKQIKGKIDYLKSQLKGI